MSTLLLGKMITAVSARVSINSTEAQGKSKLEPDWTLSLIKESAK